MPFKQVWQWAGGGGWLGTLCFRKCDLKIANLSLGRNLLFTDRSNDCFPSVSFGGGKEEERDLEIANHLHYKTIT